MKQCIQNILTPIIPCMWPPPVQASAEAAAALSWWSSGWTWPIAAWSWWLFMSWWSCDIWKTYQTFLISVVNSEYEYRALYTEFRRRWWSICSSFMKMTHRQMSFNSSGPGIRFLIVRWSSTDWLSDWKATRSLPCRHAIVYRTCIRSFGILVYYN